MDGYPNYERLRLDWAADGVLRVTIDNPGRANALGGQAHGEIARIWRDADSDARVSAILVTGAGDHFCAGGDLDWVRTLAEDPAARIAGLHEARDLVTNMIHCAKPVVSAVRGVAVGAGLAVALLADVSVVSRTARLIDGHVAFGVAAGDHAALIWPLLCGMAKAKYHLLTGEPIAGTEAERIGLVSLAVDDADVTDRAVAVATKLAKGSTTAVRWTKHALNSWLRAAEPHLDAALALEFLGFAGPDAREGLTALREKRSPVFDS